MMENNLIIITHKRLQNKCFLDSSKNLIWKTFKKIRWK